MLHYNILILVLLRKSHQFSVLAHDINNYSNSHNIKIMLVSQQNYVYNFK